MLEPSKKGTKHVDFCNWEVNQTEEALVMVKNEDKSFEARSVCSIPGFKVRESWLDYLVRLEEEEKSLLLDKECKLICCSCLNDSKIRIMSQFEDFVISFEIVNSSTLEKMEYEIKNVYGIIKQDSRDEVEYGLNSRTNESELEYLFRDLILVMNTDSRILACKIPFYVILSIYIREVVFRYRKDNKNKTGKKKVDFSLDSSTSLSISVPNYKRTIRVYSVENKNFKSGLVTCFNINHVRPYVIAFHRNKNESSFSVCLLAPNLSEFEELADYERNGSINKDSPLLMLDDTVLTVKDHQLCGSIVEDGIGFYPMKKSYIWAVSLGLSQSSGNNQGSFEEGDFKLEELCGQENGDLFTKTRIYLLETTRSNIRLLGEIESFSYCVRRLSILEAKYYGDVESELKIRMISTTIQPVGLICFDGLLTKGTNRTGKVNLSSLSFMPITNKEVAYNTYEVSSDCCKGKGGVGGNGSEDTSGLELNYSFGKGSESGHLKKRDDDFGHINKGGEEYVDVTTLCVIPFYIHSSLKKSHLHPETSDSFPLVFCGLSNGEWRIYTLKEDIPDKRECKQRGFSFKQGDNTGYFVLKGIHVLKGNEFSLVNQLEKENSSIYTKVSCSCWGFERNQDRSILSIVAFNNIGNIFSWPLVGTKRHIFGLSGNRSISRAKIADISTSEQKSEKKKSKFSCLTEEEASENRKLLNGRKKGTKEEVEADSKSKSKQTFGANNNKDVSDVLEVLDKHIRRIDERLSRVKAQDEIISRAEKFKSLLKESERKQNSGEKDTNRANKSLVPSCVSRSVSPRKGCESCNRDAEDDMLNANKNRLFLYKSKYDGMEYRRYRGYGRSEESECVFQLNNHFTIESIINSNISNTKGDNSGFGEKDILNLEKIINYESIVNNWRAKNTSDYPYVDVLFNNYSEPLFHETQP